MDEHPCIVCQNGDPFTNIICEDCERHQEWLKELFESMEQLVFINNDISGAVPMRISNKIRDEVNKIWNQLYHLKIDTTE